MFEKMDKKALPVESENKLGMLSTTVTGWLSRGFKNYDKSTALQWENQSWSYNQLDTFSNRIANYLSAHGVKKGDRVGICLGRSPEMIASIIGILKAGAAYVPLDPNYPVERLQMMCDDAHLSLLLCHAEYAGKFETVLNQIVVWENSLDIIERYSNGPLNIKISGADVAYVIFTSGSTGRPKGIAMPHRALANLIEWQLERPYFLHERNVLQYSSISFDVSFQEIATTLASGGTLFLIEDEERRDPRLLLQIMHRQNIERLFIPFVALRSLVEVAIYTGNLPQYLREVITAGEQLRVDDDLRSFFIKIPGSILENQYGPSETHVISAYLLSSNPTDWPDLPPIGTPLRHNDIYILDENMKPVEPGETGELYLAGINLAHGYVGREDLTHKAFVNNPLTDSSYSKLYKTGDLGYVNSEGEIEFLGRADHQIKVRGYRIEPGEINAVGAKYPGIVQCLTHAIQDATGKTQLVSYYKNEENTEIKEADFKDHLAASLPEYMVPVFVMQLQEISYTPSGKVDLKSLPRPLGLAPAKEQPEKYIYRDETEIKLARIWRKVLKRETVSRTDNFFDLGGDSLNAVTLFMEIEERFNKYLPLSSLVQAPTIELLAKAINGEKSTEGISRFRSLQLIQQGNGALPPLFLVHGGAGNILMFKDLADGLPPEQSVYAFQWPGWDGYAGEEDILAMAKFYTSELREASPEGPYRLGGHCIGGIIAIEIAKLLKAEGAEVLDPLLVSDAPNLHSSFYHSNEPEFSSEDQQMYNDTLRFLHQKIGAYAVFHDEQEVQAQPARAPINTKDHTARKYPLLAKMIPFYVPLAKGILKGQHQLRLLRILVSTKLGIRISVDDRELYSINAQLKAIKKHKKSVYEGDVLYFKSKEFLGRNLGLRGWWQDIFFGFRELCSGNFESHTVGGHHNDVLKKESVQKIIRERMCRIDD